MISLPSSIRILGIDWRIEWSDAPGGDPSNSGWCSVEQTTITLKSGMPSERVRQYLFWHIARAVNEHASLAASDDGGELLNSVYRLLFAALRDNWSTISKWFESEPETGPLRIGGLNWMLSRPRWVPGHGSDTMGLCDGPECVIYVRGDLSPQRAAETALHELIHAAHGRYNGDADEEAWVKCISGMLAQVFFDNEEVINAIFGGE